MMTIVSLLNTHEFRMISYAFSLFLPHFIVSQRNSKKRKNLQVSDVFEIAIPPPETIIYSKETQTLEEPQERESKQPISQFQFSIIVVFCLHIHPMIVPYIIST